VTEYAVKQNKAKEDAALIARRTRMLGTFLNRVASHPILGQDAVFHKFLDGGVSWVRQRRQEGDTWRSSCLLARPSHPARDPALASPLSLAKEQPPRARPRPDRPLVLGRLRLAADPFGRAAAPEPGPALSRERGLYEQV